MTAIDLITRDSLAQFASGTLILLATAAVIWLIPHKGRLPLWVYAVWMWFGSRRVAWKYHVTSSP